MKKLLLLSLCILVTGTPLWAAIAVQSLRVDYQTTPLGLDNPRPHFSWQMQANDAQRGYFQTAWQITVSNAKNEPLWNSQKMTSNVSHGIEYHGPALQPTTRYTWTVTIWDNKGNTASESSWFETGLLNPALSAWSGADWIGGSNDDLVFYSPYFSMYKLEFNIQLDKTTRSTKGAFVFGANDARLMNKNLNLMGVANGLNQSYIALELDISRVSESADGLALLNIYRVGYTPDDKENVPLKTLPISKKLITPANQYNKHKLYAECNFGIFQFFIDGTDAEHRIQDASMVPASPFAAPGLNLNPVGSGNNFISFPMVADIGFRVPSKQQAYFSEVAIRNFRSPSNIVFSENSGAGSYQGIFKAPNLMVDKNQYIVSGGPIITANPSRNAAPMLRTTFVAESKPLARARLYVTARGIYEIYLNGTRLGNDYFNPGLTQYNKHHMYQTYDVTQAVQSGQKNVVGAWLSEGWWSGNATYSGENWNFFGDRQSLLAKLVITYTDGTEQIITSNPASWKIYTDGPIRYGSFFQGEVYDATKDDAIRNWSTAMYDDQHWKTAVRVPLEGTTYQSTVSSTLGKSSSNDYENLKLIAQIGDNARIVKTLTAQGVEEVRPGVFVYEMGQNMVGFPQLLIKNGRKGQAITLRYAEVKYPNLADYQGKEGMIMIENIRAALTQDLYILKGGDEIIQPRFTFHGYRYLEITGIDQALPVRDVKGQVISSVTELSSAYETSNPLINQLWQNITWSLRSNFLSIPTDTPARNERMGWSGDISVFSRSATYLTDAYSFLRRHLLAMRDVQAANGRFTDVAPMGGGFGGTLWGSAGITVAWETYRQYGDKQLLAEHYEAMKRYIDFLETKIEKQTGILNEGPLGDWLSPEGNKNDNTLFWMAYFAYDLGIMQQVASILGNTSDAAHFASRQQEITKQWNEVYVDPASHRTVKSGIKTGFMGPPNQHVSAQMSDKGQLVDTQASYAIPLALDIFNETNKPFAIRYLNEAVQRRNKDDEGIERPEYSLMTGFIGTASIAEALSENGNHTQAYRLLQQTQYPSWLYSVVNGATSIWERLNSYTVENGFGGNNSMNSFNHYSFGAVASWMYAYSLGIQRAPQVAGFQSFILQPTPDPDQKIRFAKGYYDSVYGRINSEWMQEATFWTYTATVPPNTTATLILPTPSARKITESGKAIGKWNGMKQEAGKVVLPLGSGNYTFRIEK